MFRTLLIDDEPLAIDRLRRLLEPFSDEVNIIGTAANGIEAVEKILDLNPDLIFLDIQMPGLTGFEVLQELDQYPHVIFCTAYDEYALKAFETHAIDYLLKPVEPERLQLSMEKLQEITRKQSSELEPQIRSLLKHLKPETLKQIVVKTGDRIRFVPVEAVLYFQASQKYVEMYTNSEMHLISQTLNYLEENLPDDFLRIHRSSLVRQSAIHEVFKKLDGRYYARLRDRAQTVLPVSRSAKRLLGF